MKYKKVFLLCFLVQFLLQILSCSPVVQELDTEQNYLEAFVDSSFFKADDIVIIVEKSTFQIIGNNTVTNQSIFLIFKKGEGDVYRFGSSSENKEGNEASLYFKADDNEYTTAKINRNCGELKIDISEWNKGVVAGEFYFEASTNGKEVIKISKGKFMQRIN